jgi:hypothetical protein
LFTSNTKTENLNNMAEATFTLRAVDATKQAFAAVQNKLSSLQKTAKTVSVGLATFFGFSAAVGGVKRLNAFLEDAEKNAKKLGLAGQDLDRLTVATNAADEAVMKLQMGVAFLAAKLAGLFSGGDVAAQAAAIRLKRVSDELARLAIEYQKVKAEGDLINASPAVKFAAIGDAISSLNRQISESDFSVDAIKNAERKLEIGRLEKTQLELASEALNKYNDAQKSVDETRVEFSNNLKSEIVLQRELDDKLIKVGTSIRQLKEALGGNLENFNITNATPKDIAMFTELTAKLEQYNKLLQKRKLIETDLQILARNAGNLIAQGFEDAILSGQKLGEVVRALGRDLIRLVFNQMVTQRLASGIATLLGAPPIPGRAMGGPVSGGSPYVVGEQGPELFVPHASGTIVPNNKMSGGGASSGGVTVNYNIAAGVSRAELVPILDQERRRLKAEIPDMVRRGGGYRAAFA